MASRLKKKAKHDVLNRDFSILYINGEFYEDITHAACLKQFIDKNNLNDILDNYQTRPDIDIFSEVSLEVGPVVLGHHVDNEEAVYILYGVIEGEAVYFNQIPSNIINEFKDKYNLKVLDDFQHDEYSQPQPTDEDKKLKGENLYKRMFELSGYPNILDDIKNFGFSLNKDLIYEMAGIYLIPDTRKTKIKIISVGNKNFDVKPEEIFDKINSLDFSIVEFFNNKEVNYKLKEDFSIEIKGILNNDCFIVLDSYNGKVKLSDFEDPYGDYAMRQARAALDTKEISTNELQILEELDLD